MTAAFDRQAADYALEKLGDAVQLLVTMDSRVTTRVARAAEPLLRVSPRGLPPPLRGRFDKLMKRLLKHPGWRAPFNLRGMHGTTGSKLAREIYSLEIELRSYLGKPK